MNYLLDTDVIIDFLSGNPLTIRVLGELSSSRVGVSIITYGEVLYGIHQGRDRTGRGRAFEETLSWMELLGLDRETMSIFVEERARLRAAGQALADFDLLIGATAIRHGLELVTRNVRHFERMPRLSVSRMLVD